MSADLIALGSKPPSSENEGSAQAEAKVHKIRAAVKVLCETLAESLS